MVPPRRTAFTHRHGTLLHCALVTAAVSTTVDGNADDVTRCKSNRLINVGMSSAEVVARCGEPKSRSVEEFPVYSRNPVNRTVAKTDEVTRIERWTYARGQGQFDALLTFENGQLKRIDLLTSP